ncbi:LLM class flavin-dependent oxidoreductase [Paenibacillus protaetiae]|uniref:LLM class flavin-dependent oxidoreductase n=2 Tax=Paenibacillus protaetiae TaxID=2509456 RepID=A0A4P6EYU2_9BACL|nr:LLM class flavin-dependent oxidoreductase [Paenibacillus protaetiae]QAY68292.1 LLM class flavin-dependent oxidoreductase [Paenibacillus protaetiae]
MSQLGSSVQIGWFIPTTGDGEFIGIPPQRKPTQEYVTQVAVAAEEAGYELVLIPTGGDCLDSWVVGSWVASRTRNLKTLVAMRPGLMSPVLSARMAATLDQLSEGRVLINVVAGHYKEDLKATGDRLYNSHDDRYARTKEFMDIVKGVWQHSYDEAQPSFDYNGNYYELEGGTCKPEVFQRPHPPLYFGGSSEAGKRTAAEIADVYLMWTEPLEWIKEQIAGMQGYLKELEDTKGIRRELQYGIRAQVVVRETEQEAWEAAWKIISKVDPETLDERAKLHAGSDAVNQKRQMELWSQSQKENYMIGPNLWSGLTAIRGGGGVAFVGTPQQITDRLLEFVDAGVSTFILSGYPHLEEAEISGKLLMPLLRSRLANHVPNPN